MPGQRGTTGAVELPGTFGITCEHGIFAGIQNAKRCLPTTQPLGCRSILAIYLAESKEAERFPRSMFQLQPPPTARRPPGKSSTAREYATVSLAPQEKNPFSTAHAQLSNPRSG
uniref:HDC09865 n=1 Tax=Drosophila melanogaster TaxID=7227 RepID=Q6ILB3_DROME|nr:TPA_inf: HDC09865 [Drosophila melanogaster]